MGVGGDICPRALKNDMKQREDWQGENPEEAQEANRGNPSLKASSSQNDRS